MKKRLAALAAALVVLVSLAPGARAAAETVYFTAGDESVMSLTDATMPFWFGGYLYVDAALFQKCGLTYVYNTVQQSVVLFNSSRSLIFNLAVNSATDGQGNPFAHGAVSRGGVHFVPVSPVASFFGKRYSNTQVAHGYLIRVSSGAGTDDALFASAAVSTMEARYQDYLRATAPAAPDPDAVVEPEVVQPPAAGKSLYLCMEVQDADAAGQWLDTLDAWGAHGTFYFREEALRRSGALLRRLAAQGQPIGLIVSAGGEPPLEQLFRMNRVLYDAAGLKTRLVLLRDGADADAAALTEAGYCLLSPRLDRADFGLAGSGGAAALLNQATARRGAVSVWLGSEVTPSGLRSLLAAAREGDHWLLPLTETVT